jgi:hypothetical protein
MKRNYDNSSVLAGNRPPPPSIITRNESIRRRRAQERNSVAHVEAQVATRSDKKQPPATPLRDTLAN